MAWRDLNKALFWCAGNGEVDLIKDALMENKILEFNGQGIVISKNEHYQNVSYKGYRRDYRRAKRERKEAKAKKKREREAKKALKKKNERRSKTYG